MIIPEYVGHKYQIEIIYPVLVLKFFKSHRRLQVFYHKGITCVSCGCVGKYLIDAKAPDGSLHVDMYTKDFVMMTIDHKIAKSNGGSNNLSNLFPMCYNCNTKKADSKTIGDYYEYLSSM